jgi:hypothetical protein
MLKWILLAAIVGAFAYGVKFALARRDHARRRIARDQHRERARETWDAMIELQDETKRDRKG